MRTSYPRSTFQTEDKRGLFRYINWLPVERELSTNAAPITYHAHDLGKEIGVKNLYVSFNGYWPERGAQVKACSFKAYEAYPTLQRMRERKRGTLQVSSAGNTARAFAIASSESKEKVVLIVPTHALDRIWTIKPDHENILLLAVDGDYFDAITLGQTLVSKHDELLPEGGARNVARRDGMGLTMLDAVLHLGKLPEYYFQGVGSGTGGIAAYEMALKLIKDGNYGDKIPRFYLSQNAPFTPMVNAWKAGRREIIEDIDMPNSKDAIDEVYAKLLTNRRPPYGLRGGVFDVLQASDGDMISVTNAEGKAAFNLFQNVEQIDIDPAAAIAFASLINCVKNQKIRGDETVLLNISGGGYTRIMEDHNVNYVDPKMTIPHNDLISPPREVHEILRSFLKM